MKIENEERPGVGFSSSFLAMRATPTLFPLSILNEETNKGRKRQTKKSRDNKVKATREERESELACVVLYLCLRSKSVYANFGCIHLELREEGPQAEGRK